MNRIGGYSFNGDCDIQNLCCNMMMMSKNHSLCRNGENLFLCPDFEIDLADTLSDEDESWPLHVDTETTQSE